MPRRYTADEVIKVLEHFGWVFSRQRSSHVILERPGQPGQAAVPDHGSDQIAPGTFNKILRDAHVDKKEFERIAREVL